jgi:hypothetical protein
MKKRFVVVIDNTTVEQDAAFREYLKKEKFNWWHWLESLWLIIDYNGKWDVKRLRDEVNKFYTSENLLVLEIGESGSHWSGYGPKAPERNMFKWLHEHWTPKK